MGRVQCGGEGPVWIRTVDEESGPFESVLLAGQSKSLLFALLAEGRYFLLAAEFSVFWTMRNEATFSCSQRLSTISRVAGFFVFLRVTGPRNLTETHNLPKSLYPSLILTFPLLDVFEFRAPPRLLFDCSFSCKDSDLEDSILSPK